MCYNTAKNFKVDDLFDHYNAAFDSLQISDDVKSDWHPLFRDFGFDCNYAPIVTASGIRMHQWGFIGPNSKSLEQAEKVRRGSLNCVHEDMYTTPTFKEAAVSHRRCLIPVLGGFESQHINYGLKDPLKQPYYFYLDQPLALFSFGGLYSIWQDPKTGEFIPTYTVLTTQANKLMSEIHNSKLRMPVVIDRNDYRDWLDENLTIDEETKLCQPFADGRLNAYPVSSAVNQKKPTKNDTDPANFKEITDQAPLLPIPEVKRKKTKGTDDENQVSLF